MDDPPDCEIPGDSRGSLAAPFQGCAVPPQSPGSDESPPPRFRSQATQTDPSTEPFTSPRRILGASLTRHRMHSHGTSSDHGVVSPTSSAPSSPGSSSAGNKGGPMLFPTKKSPITPPRCGQLLPPQPTRDCPAAIRGRNLCRDPEPQQRELESPPRGDLKRLPVVILGAMGVGKTVLTRRLLSDCPQVELCRSCTTRQRVPGEPENNYTFVTEDQFHNMKKGGYFVEYSKIRNHWYGTKEAEITRIVDSGKIPIMDIDYSGLKSLRQSNLKARFVLITLKVKELLERLTYAGLVKKFTEEEVRQAVAQAEQGEKEQHDFDFVLWNTDVEITYHRLKSFVLQGKKVDYDKAKEELAGEVLPQGFKPSTKRVTIVLEPAGSGARQLMQRLQEEHGDCVGFPISHTTREKKAGEEDEKHYHFVDKYTFKSMFQDNAFLEFAEVGGHWYGITYKELSKAYSKLGDAQCKGLVIKVNADGAVNIKNVVVDANFVLILPPMKEGKREVDREKLINRWVAAEGHLSEAEIASRLKTVEQELELAHRVPFFFDLVMENDNVETTYKRLLDFIIKGVVKERKKTTLPNSIEVEKVERHLVDEVVQERKGEILVKKAALKSDHFPSGKAQGLEENIDGAPNFRQVAIGPDPLGQSKSHTIFGVAQPSVDGMRRVLMRVVQDKPNATVLWVNLREEPVIYINKYPFCIKHLSNVFQNLEDPGITAERVEDKEQKLKKEVVKEITARGGKLLLHDEMPAEGGLAAFGEVFAYYCPTDSSGKIDVKTAKEVMESMQAEFLTNHIEYVRLPITDEKPPKDSDGDKLLQKLWKIHCTSPEAPIIFNCQLGRGRTTTATIISTLFFCPPASPLPSPRSEEPAEFTRANVTCQRRPSEPWHLVRSVGTSTSISACSSVEDLTVLAPLESPSHEGTIIDECLQSFLTRFPVSRRVVSHLTQVINACAHIQNLWHCVLKTKSEAEVTVDERRQKALKDRARSYLRRYFYLVAMSVYLELTSHHDYHKWRQAVCYPPSPGQQVPLQPGEPVEEAAHTIAPSETIEQFIHRATSPSLPGLVPPSDANGVLSTPASYSSCSSHRVSPLLRFADATRYSDLCSHRFLYDHDESSEDANRVAGWSKPDEDGSPQGLDMPSLSLGRSMLGHARDDDIVDSLAYPCSIRFSVWMKEEKCWELFEDISARLF